MQAVFLKLYQFFIFVTPIGLSSKIQFLVNRVWLPKIAPSIIIELRLSEGLTGITLKCAERTKEFTMSKEKNNNATIKLNSTAVVTQSVIEKPLVLTAIELSDKLNNQVNATTIRSWMRRPQIGVAYDPNAVNNVYVREQIKKLLKTDDAIKATFGVSIDAINMTRSEQHSTGSVKRFSLNELEVGKEYILYSHVCKHNMKYCGSTVMNNDTLYVFEKVNNEFKTAQDKYRVLTATELSNEERWQIRAK